MDKKTILTKITPVTSVYLMEEDRTFGHQNRKPLVNAVVFKLSDGREFLITEVMEVKKSDKKQVETDRVTTPDIRMGAEVITP
jgi:hypothetical protein